MAIVKLEQETIDLVSKILEEAGIEGDALVLNMQTREVEVVTEEEISNG